MKRNIVPLLGIAVVVAILSTAVFYGLFAGKLRSSSPETTGQPIVVAAKDLERGAVLQAGDLKVSQFRGTLAGSFASADQLVGATLIAAVKQNEPLLDERVISKAGNPGSPDAVPAGMRAVSVRISESDGLIALLKPGARVDLQAVQDRNGGPELRTILQNVEVVAVSPQAQPGGGNRGPVSVVTVLARPDDADTLALADSGTRMRLSLRNPRDTDAGARRSMLLASVFQSNGVPATSSPARSAGTESRAVEIDMQVLRASAAAASQLESKVDRRSSGNSIVVAPFAAGVDSRELIQKLAAQHEVEILSERSLSASNGNSARFRNGPASGKLGIAFFTATGRDGKLNLRVQPEISSQTKNGMETRLFDADLPATGSFLVTGLVNESRDHEMLERLYPGHRWSDGRLIIVATSHESAARELSATHRGQ